MKVEMQFLLTFFCYGKKVREEMNFGFFFWAMPKKTKKASARKIQLPTLFLVAKIPETRCRSSPSNSRKF